MMDVIPLFSTPICYDEYTLDTNEIESIKKEKFNLSGPFDGYISNDYDILSKYPNLSNVVHKHIQHSLYDPNSFSIASNMKYKILSSWVNKHPPKHSAHKHDHANSMFTGVLYIDIPDNSGTLTLGVSMSTPTWITGTITPNVSNFNIFNSRTWLLPTRNGVCVLFPSHLEHWVGQNKSNYDRYTIAFNVMLEGKLSSGNNETLNIKVLDN